MSILEAQAVLKTNNQAYNTLLVVVGDCLDMDGYPYLYLPSASGIGFKNLERGEIVEITINSYNITAIFEGYIRSNIGILQCSNSVQNLKVSILYKTVSIMVHELISLFQLLSFTLSLGFTPAAFVVCIKTIYIMRSRILINLTHLGIPVKPTLLLAYIFMAGFGSGIGTSLAIIIVDIAVKIAYYLGFIVPLADPFAVKNVLISLTVLVIIPSLGCMKKV